MRKLIGKADLPKNYFEDPVVSFCVFGGFVYFSSLADVEVSSIRGDRVDGWDSRHTGRGKCGDEGGPRIDLREIWLDLSE